MKLLRDTHTFIWWDSDPRRLTPHVLEMCQDPANLLLLSVASVWEMQIKLQLGKLKLILPLAELVESQKQLNNHRLNIMDPRIQTESYGGIKQHNEHPQTV